MQLSDIQDISKNPKGKGYVIIFNDGRQIIMHKRRTIPALLTLIKHGEGCENDLTRSTGNLMEIKDELKGKIPNDFIQESYSDANKPFSELWNEEGFTFILNPAGEKRHGSQKYVLKEEDHEKLFTASKKAERKFPSKNNQIKILKAQMGLCNMCGSRVLPLKEIAPNTFSKDRVKRRWDHRIPVEKGGDSNDENYQLLCFYCNKCKWQICNICSDGPSACTNCALAYPERTLIIYPTNEDISDRFNKQSDSPSK